MKTSIHSRILKHLHRNNNLRRVLLTIAAFVIVIQTYSSIYSVPSHFKKLSNQFPSAASAAGSPHYIRILNPSASAADTPPQGVQSSSSNELKDQDIRAQLAYQYPYDINDPIPPTIWQTWKTPIDSPQMPQKFLKFIKEWQSLDPKKHNYHLVPDSLAMELIQFLYGGIPSIPHAYAKLPKSILRADFFRYLILFARGGLYSDVDTVPLKPLEEWVSHNETLYGEKNKIGLVLGIEADPDREDWADYYVHRVQFCQWSMLSKVGHPMLGELISRITEITLEKERNGTLNEFDGDGVMDWTGPGIWTREIFRYFNELLSIKGDKLKLVNPTGKNEYNLGLDISKNGIDWRYFTMMDQSVVIDDVLILPITSFSPGVGHMGSKSVDNEMAYVRHMFEGSWKEPKPKTKPKTKKN